MEPRVGREKDLTHAAAADPIDDHIRSDPRSGLQIHQPVVFAVAGRHAIGQIHHSALRG